MILVCRIRRVGLRLLVAFANNSQSRSVIFTSDVADLRALESWAPQNVKVEPVPD